MLYAAFVQFVQVILPGKLVKGLATRSMILLMVRGPRMFWALVSVCVMQLVLPLSIQNLSHPSTHSNIA